MIEVVIIEDEEQIRETLQMLIDSSEGFSCKHSFESAEDASKALPALNPDVALVDINLTGKSGIECIKEIKHLCPQTQFMICTSFEDSETVFAALKAGATGYLVKTIQPSRLLDAITEIHKGGSPMSSSIARKIVQSFNVAPVNKSIEMLSQREKDILDLLSKGLRYKEIADKLCISTETVRTHIRNIYEKLQVNSRTDALNKVYSK